jgi:hypothetical protein
MVGDELSVLAAFVDVAEERISSGPQRGLAFRRLPSAMQYGGWKNE